MELQEVKVHGSEQLFLAGWILPDTTICDDLINFWKAHPDYQRPGVAGYSDMSGVQVNKELKDSIDVTLVPQNAPPVLASYATQLQLVMNAYKDKFYWAGAYSSYALMEPVNIQYYPPGGGFKQWHTERTESHFPTIARHLVFMTYLNTVTDEGETEFFYQKTKVQPVKGLTLIWPADWTYTHRGIPSPSQEKFVITGWYSFIAQEIQNDIHYRRISK